jgi:hypothetical protein
LYSIVEFDRVCEADTRLGTTFFEPSMSPRSPIACLFDGKELESSIPKVHSHRIA